MMDFLQFTFQSFWHFWGVLITLCLAAMTINDVFGAIARSFRK